jgi:hypothetical protein
MRARDCSPEREGKEASPTSPTVIMIKGKSITLRIVVEKALDTLFAMIQMEMTKYGI